MIFTNDKYPRAKGRWRLLRTLVKKGASIGAGSIIMPGVTIGEYSLIGAGSVVTRDVPNHAIVVGSPARVIGSVKDKRFKEKVMRFLKEAQDDLKGEHFGWPWP